MTWSPGCAWLFCPANRPDRYLKALRSADLVVLDLEDAVEHARKAEARIAVAKLVDAGDYDHERSILRVNATSSPEHSADLELVRSAKVRQVMLAKAETLHDLGQFPDVEIVALLETPLGVENAGILAAAASVSGIMWGADDLIAGLGGTESRRPDGLYRDVARYARSRSLVAAKAHGKLAIDAVFMDMLDQAGLRRQCQDAVHVGFDAAVAIHPSQLSVIREAYRPAPGRVNWARRLLAHAGDERGVTTFEGRMVDGPIYRQAERILRSATADPPR